MSFLSAKVVVGFGRTERRRHKDHRVLLSGRLGMRGDAATSVRCFPHVGYAHGFGEIALGTLSFSLHFVHRHKDEDTNGNRNDCG